MECTYAKVTDEYHGWECEATGGPDAVTEEEEE